MELHIYALYALNALQFIENAILTAGSTDGEAMRDALENTKGIGSIHGRQVDDGSCHTQSERIRVQYRSSLEQ